MTEKELQKIKEWCEKATPGPWEYWTDSLIDCIAHEDTVMMWRDGGTSEMEDCIQLVGESNDPVFIAAIGYRDVIENAEFIAHAREDIPKLIAEIERLQALKQIGTCRECRWWSKDERFCDRWYGKCSCDGSSNVLFKTREDFGCIHWEAKQE